MNLAVCFGSLILLRVFKAFCTCLIPQWMPNALLLSLMVRNAHVFQPSHNSFAEPEGRRGDVRHISLFPCQNNIGMGCTCWRTVNVNSYTQLGMLCQRCSYSEASLPLGFGLEMGNLAFGISDSWQRWLMLHFPVERKIWSPVAPMVKKNLSLKSIWCDSGYSLVALSPGPCCCALRTSLDSRKSCDLILKSNWWNVHLLDLQFACTFRLPSVLNFTRLNRFLHRSLLGFFIGVATLRKSWPLCACFCVCSTPIC